MVKVTARAMPRRAAIRSSCSLLVLAGGAIGPSGSGSQCRTGGGGSGRRRRTPIRRSRRGGGRASPPVGRPRGECRDAPARRPRPRLAGVGSHHRPGEPPSHLGPPLQSGPAVANTGGPGVELDGNGSAEPHDAAEAGEELRGVTSDADVAVGEHSAAPAAFGRQAVEDAAGKHRRALFPGDGHGAGSGVDAEGRTPSSRRATTSRPAPQPTSSTGPASRASSARSPVVAGSNHRAALSVRRSPSSARRTRALNSSRPGGGRRRR